MLLRICLRPAPPRSTNDSKLVSWSAPLAGRGGVLSHPLILNLHTWLQQLQPRQSRRSKTRRKQPPLQTFSQSRHMRPLRAKAQPPSLSPWPPSITALRQMEQAAMVPAILPIPLILSILLPPIPMQTPPHPVRCYPPILLGSGFPRHHKTSRYSEKGEKLT
jgi:hypothetical protein